MRILLRTRQPQYPQPDVEWNKRNTKHSLTRFRSVFPSNTPRKWSVYRGHKQETPVWNRLNQSRPAFVYHSQRYFCIDNATCIMSISTYLIWAMVFQKGTHFQDAISSREDLLSHTFQMLAWSRLSIGYAAHPGTSNMMFSVACDIRLASHAYQFWDCKQCSICKWNDKTLPSPIVKLHPK